MPRSGISAVQIADIAIQGRLRLADASAVANLAQSIEAIGLQTPITVRRDRDKVILVAGRHRLEAAKSLGWVDIPARFLEGDADDARLWEIAENLHRAELTRLERDEHVAEWIRLTEAKRSDKLSPAETVSQKGGRGNEGGIRAAARELGINKDAAHRAIKHADIATEAKDALIAAGMDNSRAALDAVAAAPKGEQVAKVAEIVHRRDQPPDQGEAEASADSAGLEPAPPQAEPPPLVVTPIGAVTVPEPADPFAPFTNSELISELERRLKPSVIRIVVPVQVAQKAASSGEPPKSAKAKPPRKTITMPAGTKTKSATKNKKAKPSKSAKTSRIRKDTEDDPLRERVMRIKNSKGFKWPWFAEYTGVGLSTIMNWNGVAKKGVSKETRAVLEAACDRLEGGAA